MHLSLNSYRVPLLLLLPLLSGTTSGVLADGAAQGRPWGRLQEPEITAPAQQRGDGYLGRYNPWGAPMQGGHGGTSYRNHEEAREQRGNKAPARDYMAPPTYPVPQRYGPVSPYEPLGPGYYGGPLQLSPYPGTSPWGGLGINPGYGNYWNDPYGSARPDTGLLWSDMWRW